MSQVHDVLYRNIKKYELPLKLQRLYCDCGNYKAGPPGDGPPLCTNCNRYVGWFFHECVECEIFFLRDFRHPKFCAFYPTCWIHTLDLPWEYCSDHNAAPYKYRPQFDTLIEPLGLNPVLITMSKEESDDFLSELGLSLDI